MKIESIEAAIKDVLAGLGWRYDGIHSMEIKVVNNELTMNVVPNVADEYISVSFRVAVEGNEKNKVPGKGNNKGGIA